jgi:hypothetical protein
MVLLKFLQGLGFIISVLSIMTFANAATDSRSITIQLVASDHIKLKGSATSNILTEVKLADIQQKKPISLGSFGIETSTQGNCHISFDSANNYRLQHTEQENSYLMAYQLNYNGQLINVLTEITASCNRGNGLLTLIPTDNMPNIVPKGTYQDKLRIVVTTP